MAEKRRHHRFVVDLPVEGESADGVSFSGLGKDISVGGMFVESETPLAFGSQVTLRVRTSESGELTLPGIVRWRKPHGFGVQFGLLGAQATFAIVELIKQSQP